MSSHPDIDKVAFTGSVEVGRLVMKAAAESNLKKVTLELGGKVKQAPFSFHVRIVSLIIECVYVCAPVAGDYHGRRRCGRGSENHAHGHLFNQGQVCTASSRIYVHDSIYDSFVAKATAAAKARVAVTGDPFDPATQQGAQVSEEQYKRIMGYIDIGKRDNKLQCGGVRKGEKGYL